MIRLSSNSEQSKTCNKINSPHKFFTSRCLCFSSQTQKLIGFNNNIMSDALKIIKDDHRKVEAQFKKFESYGDRAVKAKQTTALLICELLTVHAEMEEQIFYPKLLDKFKKKGDELVDEAYAEHDVAKYLIAKIKTLPPEDPQFDAKVIVLKEYIAHHVQEEEKELLPMTKKQFSKEELSEMGVEMENFKNANA